MAHSDTLLQMSLIQPAAVILITLTCVVTWYKLSHVPTVRFYKKSTETLQNIGHHEALKEVHSLEAQSLGVVSDNLRQQILGKFIKDPRRNLQLVAMWLEAPTFVFVILGSMIGDLKEEIQGKESFEEGQAMGMLTTFMITSLVIGIIGLVTAAALLKSKNKRGHDFLQTVLFPLIFDVGFISISASGIRLVTCQPGMDLYFNTPDSCQNINLNQVGTTLIGLSVFFCLYFGALHIKTHREASALLVRIRFHSEFLVLTIAARTSISLYNANKTLLLSFVSVPVTHIILGFIYSFGMIFMVVYNYYYQPCLGSGRMVNNIRTVTFTSGAASSVMVLATGLMELSGNYSSKETHDTAENFLFIGIPISLFLAWVINDKRALKFHIPELHVAHLMETDNERYRQVACVVVCLIPQEMLANDMKQRIQRTLKSFISGNCSSNAQALVCLAYLHIQCLEQPDNPFGFIINEKEDDVCAGTWASSISDFNISKENYNYQRHAVHRNFRLGQLDTTTAKLFHKNSERSARRNGSHIVADNERILASSANLTEESKEKIQKMFEASKTSEAAVRHCFKVLTTLHNSEKAKEAAAKAVLDLLKKKLITVSTPTFFRLAFHFSKCDGDCINSLPAITTLHQYLLKSSTFDTTSNSSPILICLHDPNVIYNVSTFLIPQDSKITTQMIYAAEILFRLLQLYAKFKMRNTLGHPKSMSGLLNMVRARKKRLAIRKSIESHEDNLVINYVSASILLYFGIVVQDLDLNSILITRISATSKVRKSSGISPAVQELFNSSQVGSTVSETAADDESRNKICDNTFFSEAVLHSVDDILDLKRRKRIHLGSSRGSTFTSNASRYSKATIYPQ